MFIAALFIIAKIQNQPKCPEIDDWVEKLWHIYTMEYYTAIRDNEILLFNSKWMNIDGLMLSEVSQTLKDTYCISPFSLY